MKARVPLAELSADTLRELGAALIRRAVAMEAAERAGRAELNDEGIDRLAAILAAGSRPTIVFYCRYRVCRDA
jgi:hypothetical protein